MQTLFTMSNINNGRWHLKIGYESPFCLPYEAKNLTCSTMVIFEVIYGKYNNDLNYNSTDIFFQLFSLLFDFEIRCYLFELQKRSPLPVFDSDFLRRLF